MVVNFAEHSVQVNMAADCLLRGCKLEMVTKGRVWILCDSLLVEIRLGWQSA